MFKSLQKDYFDQISPPEKMLLRSTYRSLRKVHSRATCRSLLIALVHSAHSVGALNIMNQFQESK